MKELKRQHNLRGLDWDEILQKISSYATSDPGRLKVLETTPLLTVDDALRSFGNISEAQVVLGHGIRPFMESLNLFASWFQRLAKNAVLKPLELRDVRSFCLEVVALEEALKPSKTPWSDSVSMQLMKAAEPLSAIDQIMTPSGEIRTDASEKLFQLYNEKTALTRQIQNQLDKLVKKHEMETLLQDKYVTNREGRWVLPIKSGRQHAFEGIIHASSQTKQTVFMEPQEIIPTNNRLREVEVLIEEEIERLLTELSNYLYQKRHEFSLTHQCLLDADVVFAKAQFSNLIRGEPCQFREGSLRLKELRNPLLVLNNSDVVANDIELDVEHRILLLSGPNAGGKTVLLKSVGLAAQMARCGLLICASRNSEVSFFEEIRISVGDEQSVEDNLSTFAAHLKNLNQALEMKGLVKLLLIDEICGSTDPEEGAAIARSFIEHYAEQGIFAIITSHLGPLKLGWTTTSGVVNGSLEYDPRTSSPTYQFLLGVPGQSLAIQTARRVGVSDSVLERALSHLSPHSRKVQEGLAELETLKESILQSRKDYESQKQKALRIQERFRKRLDELQSEKSQMLERIVRKAEKRINEMIDFAKVDDTFKKFDSLQKIKAQLPEIIKTQSPSSHSASRNGEYPLEVNSQEAFALAFPPGSSVFVPSIGRDGVVQAVPNQKGEVTILSQSMRLVLPWNQLKPPQKPLNPTAELVRRSHTIAVGLSDPERTVDLRGMTVEEAIAELENHLDQATLQGVERMKVIHGHGTDALKKAVRSHLSRSVYVRTWRTGSAEGQSDGVTWVELGSPT